MSAIGDIINHPDDPEAKLNFFSGVRVAASVDAIFFEIEPCCHHITGEPGRCEIHALEFGDDTECYFEISDGVLQTFKSSGLFVVIRDGALIVAPRDNSPNDVEIESPGVARLKRKMSRPVSQKYQYRRPGGA